MASKTKVFEYSASLAEDGTILAEQADGITLPNAWLPEHLVLVAVAGCTLTALRHHARKTSVSGSAAMHGTVTRRGTDGRFALVDVTVDLEVALEPEPDADALGRLLARAERDCFVGNSLTARPRYSWRVNGRPAAAAEGQ